MEPLDMPDDPFPNMEVLAFEDVALLIMVNKDGHLRFRSAVSTEYALYAVRSVVETLERRLTAEQTAGDFDG